MLPGLAWPGPGHGLARAWPWPGQAMAKWRWGEVSCAGPGTLGTPVPRPWLGLKRHLAMAWPGHGQALARQWPGPGQARPGNILLEMIVNYR